MLTFLPRCTITQPAICPSGWPAGLTLIITQTHVFYRSQKSSKSGLKKGMILGSMFIYKVIWKSRFQTKNKRNEVVFHQAFSLYRYSKQRTQHVILLPVENNEVNKQKQRQHLSAGYTVWKLLPLWLLLLLCPFDGLPELRSIFIYLMQGRELDE